MPTALRTWASSLKVMGPPQGCCTKERWDLTRFGYQLADELAQEGKRGNQLGSQSGETRESEGGSHKAGAEEEVVYPIIDPHRSSLEGRVACFSMNQVCAVPVTVEGMPLGFQAPSLEGWHHLRWGRLQLGEARSWVWGGGPPWRALSILSTLPRWAPGSFLRDWAEERRGQSQGGGQKPEEGCPGG